jgi:hypothetical protein
MRKDEEHPVAGSSEDQLQRPLRHIDFCNLPPVVGVDENLPVGCSSPKCDSGAKWA